MPAMSNGLEPASELAVHLARWRKKFQAQCSLTANDYFEKYSELLNIFILSYLNFARFGGFHMQGT